MVARKDVVQQENDKAGMILLDLLKLEEVCMHKDTLIDKLLNLYLQQAPGWIDEFERAVVASDSESLCKLCHTVEGATAAVYALSCVEVVKDLHSSAREGSDDKIGEKAQKVISVIKATGDLIKLALKADSQ